jgi:hypothetical protein
MDKMKESDFEILCDQTEAAGTTRCILRELQTEHRRLRLLTSVQCSKERWKKNARSTERCDTVLTRTGKQELDTTKTSNLQDLRKKSHPELRRDTFAQQRGRGLSQDLGLSPNYSVHNLF